MITPCQSYKITLQTWSLLLNFQTFWYIFYLCNMVCFFSFMMVLVWQASINQQASTKAVPAQMSSKSNLSKPPKAPKHSSSKEPQRNIK